MTCASCAARIEKKLNRMDGVTATVNYATEKAKVGYAEGVDVDDLDRDGRGHRIHRRAPARRRRDPHRPAGPDAADCEDAELASLRRRLTLRGRPGRAGVVLAMVPALQFDNWQWLSLALAAPVVVWAGLALPPGGLDEPPARRRHHGHADLASARWPPSAGRCGRCSSATPGCRA